MTTLTLDKAIELHRELWMWLSETGEMKDAWPLWEEIEKEYGEMPNCCFACAIAHRRAVDIYNVCSHCPIDWSNGGEIMARRCQGNNGLYRLWQITDKKTRKEIAEKIANLPVKADATK